MAKPKVHAVLVAALVGCVGLLSACMPADVNALTSKEQAGRNSGTAGWLLSQRYLLDRVRSLGHGPRTGVSGDEAYLQRFPGGANILVVIPGTDRKDEYVVVGAHYDHLGSSCRTSVPSDTICNGATDNAAGVAVALEIGERLKANPGRRSVVIALWDGEEDGLVGSRYYADHPILPRSKVRAYVNYDIQGANLLPNLRTNTFALASETGGAKLRSIVEGARDQDVLQTTLLSSIFGQGRSDHVAFIGAKVPTVFFTDSTNACYHTAQDEAAVVDQEKLGHQAELGTRVVRSLTTADGAHLPAFAAGTPLATYADAVGLDGVIDRAWVDKATFTPADLARATTARNHVKAMVADGEGAFGSDDVSTLLVDASAMVSILTHGPCRSYVPTP